MLSRVASKELQLAAETIVEGTSGTDPSDQLMNEMTLDSPADLPAADDPPATPGAIVNSEQDANWDINDTTVIRNMRPTPPVEVYWTPPRAATPFITPHAR
jgi:hypothetical protein